MPSRTRIHRSTTAQLAVLALVAVVLSLAAVVACVLLGAPGEAYTAIGLVGGGGSIGSGLGAAGYGLRHYGAAEPSEGM